MMHSGFFICRENVMSVEDELVEIERAVTYQDRMLKELNAVVIEQGREIEKLKHLVDMLTQSVDVRFVKPLSEETPPPHY